MDDGRYAVLPVNRQAASTHPLGHDPKVGVVIAWSKTFRLVDRQLSLTVGYHTMSDRMTGMHR